MNPTPALAPILVGTASWTDRTLIACGRFYPPEAKTPEQRLRHYATQFPVVEVDSSYYGMPTPANARLWAERTPPGFRFNVKAFRLFTGHQTSPLALHKDLQQALGPRAPQVLYYRDTPAEIRAELWRRFVEALAPLKHAGKLGAVHFQFAPWVLRNREGLAHLEHCAQSLPGHLLAAEFRNHGWFDGANARATLERLAALGMVHTIVDEPQGFSNCVPCIWEVTQPALAVVRLHGRNTASWNARGPASSSRFKYLYSAAELQGMRAEVLKLAERAREVHLLFNTNYEDHGQANARLMRQMLAAGA